MNAEIVKVDEGDYHRDEVGADVPTLSSSIAKILIASSPAHARNEHPKLNPQLVRTEEKKFDLGTAAHALLLEGRDDTVEVIDAPDFRTNAAKAARSMAYLAGKTPVLAKHWGDIEKMVGAARVKFERITPTPFTDGKPEQTIVWVENGAVCRARLDWLRDDYTIVDDYKTTGASAAPEQWGRTMYGFGGDIQVAFYSRGIRALTGRQPLWRFIVQELSPPYAVCPFALPPAALAIADAKVEYAIDTWRRCLATDLWPAYPDEVCYLPPPPWAEMQWLDRAARDSVSTDRRAA